MQPFRRTALGLAPGSVRGCPRLAARALDVLHWPFTGTRRDREMIYLFYDGYERRAAEGLARFYEPARSLARRAWRTLKGQQVYTGFYVAFENLVRSLEAAGCSVRVNDFVGAR